MQVFHEIAKGIDVHEARLTVFKLNTGARKLYEGLGYVLSRQQNKRL